MTGEWVRVLTRRTSLVVTSAKIVGKARPRMTKSGEVYTPKATANAERRIRNQWKLDNGIGMKDWTGPVGVEVYYTRPLAKSNPKYWAGRADLGKPDADNVGKLVLDALNGLAFADDCQVVRFQVTKGHRTDNGTDATMVIIVEYYTETYQKDAPAKAGAPTN